MKNVFSLIALLLILTTANAANAEVCGNITSLRSDQTDIYITINEGKEYSMHGWSNASLAAIAKVNKIPVCISGIVKKIPMVNDHRFATDLKLMK